MAEPILGDELLRDRARVFEEFLSDFPDHDYNDDVITMLNEDGVRLLVNIDDIRQYNRDFAYG